MKIVKISFFILLPLSTFCVQDNCSLEKPEIKIKSIKVTSTPTVVIPSAPQFNEGDLKYVSAKVLHPKENKETKQVSIKSLQALSGQTGCTDVLQTSLIPVLSITGMAKGAWQEAKTAFLYQSEQRKKNNGTSAKQD